MIVWKILLVDQSKEDYLIIQDYLSLARSGKFDITWVADLQAAWDQLADSAYDLVLVDYNVGEGAGIEFIHQAVSQGNQTPFLLITGLQSYDIDLQAMHAGAKDYLYKGELSPALLERSIRYAIEARKNVQALKESEERFKLATRAVNGVVYDWDLASNLIFRSDGLKQVIGIGPCEITQEHGWWERRVHPEDYPLVEKIVNERINGTADTYELEYRLQHMEGYWIDVWEKAYILRDERGKAYRVVGTRTDITDRKRNEQNNRFLAELGEQMLTLEDPEMMFAYASDALMRYLDLNRISFDLVDQKAEKITVLYEQHIDPPAIVGVYEFSPFHHELQKRMIKGQAMVVSDTSLDPDTAPYYETNFSKANFRSFVAIPRLLEDVWIATMSVATGEVRHWRDDEVALLKQTSDLVWLAVENARLVKQLRDAQSRFEIALKNSQITIYTCDRDRRYTWVANFNMRNGVNEIIGKRDEDIVDPMDFREVIEAKNQVIHSGIGIQKQFAVHHSNRFIYLDMNIEPMRNTAGAVEGLIVAVSDKTQRYEYEQQIQDKNRQLEIQRRIEQIREEERQQIGRDLHDGPIQNAVGLLFSIKSVESLISDPQAIEILEDIHDETQTLISELRNVCNDLRPPVLVQFGLSSAIRSHANDFQQKHPEVTVHLEIYDAGRLLPENVRLTLYRIYQEAMNNVARHANATEVTVSLSTSNKILQLEIADNGEGFTMNGQLLNLAREGHYGLVGMQERAESIGGELHVSSRSGIGTQITVDLPILEVAV